VPAPVASDSLLTYTPRLHCPLRTTPRPSFIKSPHELWGLPRDSPGTAHLPIQRVPRSTFGWELLALHVGFFWGLAGFPFSGGLKKSRTMPVGR
jgi:hypothetical protein